MVNIRTTGFDRKPLHFAHAQYNYRVRMFQKGNRLFPDTTRNKGSLLRKFSVFSVNINYILSNVQINLKFRTENRHFFLSPSCLFPSGYCPICIIRTFLLKNSLKGGHTSISNDRVYQCSHAAILKQRVGTLGKPLVMRQFRGYVHGR